VEQTLELRPYQVAALQSIQAVRSTCRSALVALPTGTGKTVLAAALLQTARRGVFLVHRDELAEQAARTLSRFVAESDIGVCKGSVDEVDRRVVVGSIQTLARRRRRERLLASGRPEVVVVDEAHHAAAPTWKKVIEGLDAEFVLGITATPERADGSALGFEAEAFRLGIADAIASGWLADVRGIQIELAAMDWSRVSLSGGDFDAGSLGDALEDAQMPAVVTAAWHRYGEGRRTIVFTPTIALAEAVAMQFAETGVTAEAVHGNMSLEDRRLVIERFRQGQIQVTSNAMLLTEGTDIPEVACIIVARPTRSRSLYAQMIGRGLRLAPQKTDCLIMDLYADRDDVVDLATFSGVQHETLQAGLQSLIHRIARGEPLPIPPVPGSLIDDLVQHIKARTIEVIERTTFHWVQVGRDWIISAPQYTLRLRDQGNGLYQVIATTQEGVQVLIKDADLELATGVAEDAIRRAGWQKLASRNATWRTSKAATAKQIARLAALNWQGDVSSLTAGEASDLITALENAIPATKAQMAWLKHHGVDPSGLSKREASSIISQLQNQSQTTCR